MILRFQGEERDIIMLRRKKKYETHLVSCALNFARDAFAYVYLIIQLSLIHIFRSTTGHEKPCGKAGGPPPKAKYYLVTDRA